MLYIRVMILWKGMTDDNSSTAHVVALLAIN
jgi:hypothetical protein